MRIRIDDREVQKLLKDLDISAEVMREAYRYFYKHTPKDKGNARRNTKLENDRVIIADYAYAQRLDEGYSKQSPDGMTKPTEEFIKSNIDKRLKGL